MKTVIITGMPGCGMREVARNLEEKGELLPKGIKVNVRHVGDLMHYIDTFGRAQLPSREEWEENILDRPRAALSSLRKAVFERILAEQTSLEAENGGADQVLVVTVHATFFWRHDVQIGTPFAYLDHLKPDFFVTVVDDLDRVAKQLYRQARWQDLSLQEMLWWRAVETSTTAAVASALQIPHYVLARDEDARTLANLIAHRPQPMKCAYASYPISHVGEEELKQSQEFVEQLRDYVIVFDPLKIRDVEYGRGGLSHDYDQRLGIDINKADPGHLIRLRGCGHKLAGRIVDHRSAHGPFACVADLTEVKGVGDGLVAAWGCRVYADKPIAKFDAKDLDRVRKQLDHQTVSRDYDLIDQSDYVMVHYTKTELEGKEGEDSSPTETMPLSAGVICEMKHAYSHCKKVYAVWQSTAKPSPFFDFYCTDWKNTKEDLLNSLLDEGVITERDPAA